MNRTHDLPACITMPQPTAQSRATECTRRLTEIHSTKKWNLIGDSTGTLPPALSPNSKLPSPFQCTFIAVRGISKRILKVVVASIFFYVLSNCISETACLKIQQFSQCQCQCLNLSIMFIYSEIPYFERWFSFHPLARRGYLMWRVC